MSLSIPWDLPRQLLRCSKLSGINDIADPSFFAIWVEGSLRALNSGDRIVFLFQFEKSNAIGDFPFRDTVVAQLCSGWVRELVSSPADDPRRLLLYIKIKPNGMGQVLLGWFYQLPDGETARGDWRPEIDDPMSSVMELANLGINLAKTGGIFDEL